MVLENLICCLQGSMVLAGMLCEPLHCRCPSYFRLCQNGAAISMFDFTGPLHLFAIALRRTVTPHVLHVQKIATPLQSYEECWLLHCRKGRRARARGGEQGSGTQRAYMCKTSAMSCMPA